MAWSFLNAFYGLVGLALLWLAVQLLQVLWLRPRRLERVLRAQGLRGTSYCFLTGDLNESHRLNKEARSRPFPLGCHDIGQHIFPLIYNTAREHGKTCFFWSGPVPNVAMCDAGHVKEMLSDKLGKRIFPAVAKLLTNGLDQQEGHKWVHQRKTVNPAFSIEAINHATPAFSACCQEMVMRWTERLGRNGAGEMDVWAELSQLSGEVISRTAFGSSYLEATGVFQLQTEQIERLVSTFWNFLLPGYVYLPTPNNRRMHQINREIESTLRRLIGKRVHQMEQGISTKHDMLGLLLESNAASEDTMTIQEIVENSKLFYFAGSETTAILLTWTMVVLSMHTEWQARAREEVLGLFGKSKPKYQDLDRLKTVTMILHEVLRLYPPAAMIKRKIYKEAQIGGVTYPAGIFVDVPVLLIHHDSDIWGSDVHEFRPERFAQGIAKASKVQGAYIPFGLGPRNCIGQNYAMVEGKIALCMILQHFEFELAPAYTHAPHYLVTLQPMHGAQIKLTTI
ncbi:unnamed protein product [Alopecurus aequalis]